MNAAQALQVSTQARKLKHAEWEYLCNQRLLSVQRAAEEGKTSVRVNSLTEHELTTGEMEYYVEWFRSRGFGIEYKTDFTRWGVQLRVLYVTWGAK